jgi:hypothetical protein
MRKWIIRVLLVSLGLGALLLVCAWWGSREVYSESPTRNAETGARIVRLAIQQWQAAHHQTGCPSIEQLVQEQQLDPGQNSNDSWNQPYRFRCTEHEVVVLSSGPDKQFGTADDVRMPRETPLP